MLGGLSTGCILPEWLGLQPGGDREKKFAILRQPIQQDACWSGSSSMPATPHVVEDTLARVRALSWEEAVEVTCEDSGLILGSDAESCQRVTLLLVHAVLPAAGEER